MCKSIKLLLLCITISSYTNAYAATQTVSHIADTNLTAKEKALWDRLKVSEGTREKLLKNPQVVNKLPKRSRRVGKLNLSRLSLWEPKKEPAQVTQQAVKKAIQQMQKADVQITQIALKQPNISVEQRRQLEGELELSKLQLEKAYESRTKNLQKASIVLANTDFIMAIQQSNSPLSAPLLATVRELDNPESVPIPNDHLLLADMVQGRKSAHAVVRFAKEQNLDLSEQLPEDFMGDGGGPPPPDDDSIVEQMSRDDQKLLYIATMNRIDQEDPDAADAITKEVTVLEQPEIVLYDEIPRIATDTTNARVSELLTGFIPAGIAAGDENTLVSLKSVWVRGLYGDINQGNKSGQIGFHGKTKGGTIGIDGNLTDDTIIGLSYTRMAANFKYKQGQGNKVDTMSDFVSLYGISNLNKNFVLHGLLSVGKTRAKQQTQHLVGPDTYRTATGKTTVTIYNLESILNYKIPVNNPEVYIMPNVGFRFNKNYDGGYSEYGAGLYNLTVSSKQHSSWAVITGIKMGKAHRVSDCLTITTGIHAEIDHYVYNKTSQAKTKMQWADTFLDSESTTVMIKTDKTGYNLGASILAADEMSEFLATYNLHLRGKYTSHQGSFRFRFLF